MKKLIILLSSLALAWAVSANAQVTQTVNIKSTDSLTVVINIADYKNANIIINLDGSGKSDVSINELRVNKEEEEKIFIFPKLLDKEEIKIVVSPEKEDQKNNDVFYPNSYPDYPNGYYGSYSDSPFSIYSYPSSGVGTGVFPNGGPY